MNDTQRDLIYLLFCSVNGITPDAERVQAMDLELLYKMSGFHMVRAAVYIALKRAGVENVQFDQAYKKAIRKNIYLDMEKTAILADFEKQGIWHMPLKGALLKDIYPENGMREMSDCDVLFDAEKQVQVRDIMVEHGYTVMEFGEDYHDVYQKPPILNFEMHTALFDFSEHFDAFHAYYSDVKHLLHKDDGSEYGYHFSDDDFYVFMTAHEYKHSINTSVGIRATSGTGIRSLLDCYVYCKYKSDVLHWDYIQEQCSQLGIADYEQERRELADKLFSSEILPELTEQELDMLMDYLTSGAYGTVENTIKKQMKNQSKGKYILSHIFPNLDYMKQSVKFVDKCPALYPIGIVYRWGRILLLRRDYIKKAIKTVNEYGKPVSSAEKPKKN